MKKWTLGLSGMALGLMLTGSAFACHKINDGEVTKIDAAKNSITVATASKEKTFTTGDKTQVTIDGKEGSLADLKAGDKVDVDYEAADDVLAIKVTRQS